jgi:hypothetical protein
MLQHLLPSAPRVLDGPQAGHVPGHGWRGTLSLVGITLVCGCCYGAVMGCFGGVGGERFWQVCISSIKVPCLLLVTFAISAPSFFVLNTLLGVRSDFRVAVRILLGGQAGLTLVLAALAPYTLLWYASSADYPLAVLFNGLIFAIASFTAQGMLRGWYRPLAARTPRHRWLLRLWLVLYTFVGIQMAWVLRPFVGDPASPVELFRAASWANAYVIVGRAVWAACARLAR